jgi:SAM-dependent methyltransferase
MRRMILPERVFGNADGTFDVVYTRDVLHHLADDAERKRFFSEMKRVVNRDGVIVIVEPNPRNPMLFAFSYLVRAERGILTGTEKRICRLLPGAYVARTTPSVAWRGWYHYRSPLRAWAPSAAIVRVALRGWEAVCRRMPKAMWAWRVYSWNVRDLDVSHEAD